MDTVTRVRLAAALCVGLGAFGAGGVYLRVGLARPALLLACVLAVAVGVVLHRRADRAAERRPGW